MADLVLKYRVPEAKVKPLTTAIRARNPSPGDEDGNPIPETDMETIDRFVITVLRGLEQKYRRRRLSADLDADIVRKEP